MKAALSSRYGHMEIESESQKGRVKPKDGKREVGANIETGRETENDLSDTGGQTKRESEQDARRQKERKKERVIVLKKGRGNLDENE